MLNIYQKNMLQRVKWTQKIKNGKYNTHVQREVELYSTGIPIMEKVQTQQFVKINPIPFHNYYPVNYQIDNKGNILVEL